MSHVYHMRWRRDAQVHLTFKNVGWRDIFIYSQYLYIYYTITCTYAMRHNNDNQKTLCNYEKLWREKKVRTKFTFSLRSGDKLTSNFSIHFNFQFDFPWVYFPCDTSACARTEPIGISVVHQERIQQGPFRN